MLGYFIHSEMRKDVICWVFFFFSPGMSDLDTEYLVRKMLNFCESLPG